LNYNEPSEIPSSRDYSQEQIEEIGFLLLDIGTLLMSSGANTERIRQTINRFATGFGIRAELLITHQALMLTMSQRNRQIYSHLKRCSQHAINFKILSGISRLSWSLMDKDHWTLKEIQSEIKRIRQIPVYPRWLILLLVSLSGASFCRLFGGDFLSMLITFFATFMGLVIRQELSIRKFNFYLCIFAASFGASLISGFFLKLVHNVLLEHSLASSILFLAPGIPLINSFSDFIDGNLLNGVLRGLNGFIIAFSMGLGWLLAVMIYGI
jgi:uncharacterized membrane protein YjjP (DUF1212 family)